jgi:RNA polymerase sigma factor (sigma-70 family)
MTAIEFNYQLINLQEGLMRYAYSLTTDKDDAKDLLQETFLKALKYCNKFVHDTNFNAWIFTIMKNTFINHYNRRKHYNTDSNQTKEGFCESYLHASGADDPDSAYSSKELERIINELDDNLKLPFKMHHEGFKYKEIAETLDMKLGTVKSRIFFTRKKLMEQLDR